MKNIIVLLFLFVAVNYTLAEEPYVPESLKEWKTWVEQANPEWSCAKIGNAYTCSWPGKLKFDLTQGGANFNLSVVLLADTEIPLPATSELRPTEIQVTDSNGLEVSSKIITRDSAVFLKLAKGKYQIKGLLSWESKPKNLPIPSSYGLVEITEAGKELSFNRSDDSAWLSDNRENQTEKSLFLSVFRKVTDGSPLEIETLIRVKATGLAHTIDLGKILPLGATPVKTESELSHQLTPEGNLTLQVKPGSYQISITSVTKQPVEKISLQKTNAEQWPEYEVWSMYDNKSFRSVEFIGAKAVTASNTELPEEWANGSTYYVETGGEVQLKELSRGINREEENNLALSRQMWLDLDGKAFTISDTLNATIKSGFRLNVDKGLELGRAQINGQDQQITKDPKTGALGVEIRDLNISLNAVSRLKSTNTIPAVGWNNSLSSFTGTLNLGPSWKLLHISGAENVVGSWLSSWTLMDLFIGILMVVASYRLFGKVFAFAVLAATLLNKGEYLEPRLMLIHLVIAVLIYRLTREASEYWKNVTAIYLYATFAIWTVMVATFSKLQLTQLLFPQLQAGTRYRTVLQELLFFIEGWFLSWPSLGASLLLVIILIKWIRKAATQFQAFIRVMLSAVLIFTCIPAVFGMLAMFSGPKTYQTAQYARQQNVLSKTMGSEVAASSMYGSADVEMLAAAPEQKVKFDTPTAKLLQTGPALPNWSWRSFQFTLAGPISPEREINIYLVSPAIERFLSLIRFSLLILISIFLWRNLGFRIPKLESNTLVLLLVINLLLLPTKAQADYPSTELLKSLSTRLEKNLCQQQDCASIETLSLSISNNEAIIKLKYSSDGASGVILPGPLDQLEIKSVKQDGEEINALRRDNKNFLIAKTSDGRHTLEIIAKLAGSQVINLEFPHPPLKTTVDAKNWQVEGLLPGGVIKGTLQLIPSNSNRQEIQETVLPSWFIVTRKLDLGDKFNVTTIITRMGDLLRPSTVKFQALKGEKIATEGIRQNENIIEARFDNGASELIFESSLSPNNTLELTAVDNLNVSESWELTCSSLYRCKSEGIAASNLFLEDKYTTSWLPFPGEKVKIYIEALKSAEGDLITIDNLRHSLNWGTDLLQGTVTARIRNTEQKTLNFAIPKGANLKNLSLDNVSISSVSKENKHSVLISPGEHDLYFSYDSFWKPSSLATMPVVNVDAKLNNVNIQINPSADRWILFTGGLVWGPAVLFWPKLLIIIFIILSLTKFNYLPASKFGAVMLSFGLAVLPTIFMAIPLIWLAIINAPDFVLEKSKKLNSKIRLGAFVALSVITICLLYRMIHSGLILQPPMLIVGNSSNYSTLNWFIDHSTSNLPQPWVLSLPMWCWRVLMLVWSTWLVFAITGWSKKVIETGKTLA